MRGAGIGDHADGFAAFGQKDEEFPALEHGDALIGFPVQDQERSGDAVDVHHGGIDQERSGIFFLEAHVVIDLEDVAFWNKTEPIGDARAFDGGFVAVGLCDGPGGHEAAGAPTKDGEAIGVCPSLGDGKIGGAIDILIGAIAEMLIDGFEEFGAIASRATVLRLQDDIAETSDDASEGVEAERVVRFRTAMRENEEWISFAIFVAWRAG